MAKKDIDVRKLRRLQHAVERQWGALPTDEPHRHVVLCNAGLSTGLREVDLATEFSPYGAVDEYVLVPDKSFCVVSYEDAISAKRAHANLHGSRKLTQHGHKLYLSFLPWLPLNVPKENIKKPDGLLLIEDFISAEEEEMLLMSVKFDEMEVKGAMKNRKVKHYGYEFLYDVNNVDVNKPLEQSVPECCNFLWEKLEKEGHKYEKQPDQLTINQYDPGHGIPSHVDTHSAFLSPLIVLSLGGAVVMDFKRISERYYLTLPPRSLMILDGSSRYEWSHGISPKTYDIIKGKVVERTQRTSLTFRWVRPDGKCSCHYHQQCDTFKKAALELEKPFEKYASLIEDKHVHDVYEEIADHFSETRMKVWPCASKFIHSLPVGSIMADLGCGNGKHFHIRYDVQTIGLDYSDALLMSHDFRKRRIIDCVRGDCLILPYLSESFDAALSVAVFHHFVTEERRINAIREAARILRSDGRALITVWAKDQSRDKVKTNYLKQSKKNRNDDDDVDIKTDTEVLTDKQGQSIDIELPIHVNRTGFVHNDMLVPWKKKILWSETQNPNDKKNTFMRFYHLFEEGELERICQTIEGVDVEESFYEQGNWCVILKKK